MAVYLSPDQNRSDYPIILIIADQAKSLLALLAPKDVTETRLWVGRVSLAASGIPVGVYTVRPSRRGHDADVTLARGSQYSTQPASACHTCHPQGKNSPPWIGPRLVYFC